ncbi:hypothetical protein [Enorma massiliensis]|uniref:hypothetical protein n=1 Tax=Enorma massiliensis TaxID=1472761 RepID=UPI002E7713BD|nr:hypothetical protein [Enorma massiliensis]
MKYTDLLEQGSSEAQVQAFLSDGELGGGEIEAAISRINAQGAGFRYNVRGSHATRGASGWFMRGYPEHEDDRPIGPMPLVTQTELDMLDEGDIVFHKAFGYGHVVELGEAYILISFDDDDKRKKPSRKFGFPSAFFQGLLRIV